MLKEKLDQCGCLALDWLMCQLAIAHELIFRNRRMTAHGAVLALAFIGAHYGLHISTGTQTVLATIFTLYLGIAGRDKPKRSL